MDDNMGDLVLVLGDMHIPHRSAGIPKGLKKMLVRSLQIVKKKIFFSTSGTHTHRFQQVPNKMQHILCTGNLCSQEQLDDLKLIAPKVHVVKGDFDEVRSAIFLIVVVTIIIYQSQTTKTD